MNHQDAEVTDVIIVLEELDDNQTTAVVAKLQAVGLTVSSVDNDTSTIEGSIFSDKVHDLHDVGCVRYVRSVVTYTCDFPAGDPRDKDGVEEVCDESED